jgi:hypothetical protein
VRRSAPAGATEGQAGVLVSVATFGELARSDTSPVISGELISCSASLNMLRELVRSSASSEMPRELTRFSSSTVMLIEPLRLSAPLETSEELAGVATLMEGSGVFAALELRLRLPRLITLQF